MLKAMILLMTVNASITAKSMIKPGVQTAEILLAFFVCGVRTADDTLPWSGGVLTGTVAGCAGAFTGVVEGKDGLYRVGAEAITGSSPVVASEAFCLILSNACRTSSALFGRCCSSSDTIR